MCATNRTLISWSKALCGKRGHFNLKYSREFLSRELWFAFLELCWRIIWTQHSDLSCPSQQKPFPVIPKGTVQGSGVDWWDVRVRNEQESSRDLANNYRSSLL